MTRFTWLATLMAVAGFALGACGGKDGGGKTIEKAEEGTFLRVLRADTSPILDPHATDSGGNANVIQQMYEGLVKPSRKQPVTWEPCLAESWLHDEEHKVWTFVIRQGVKFHDGTELDANVVKRSFDRIIIEDDPAQPIERPYRVDYFGFIKDVQAPDANTVVITLKTPRPNFIVSLGLFSGTVISSKALEHMATISDPKARSAWLTSHSAGTGPFRVAKPSDFVDGATVTLTAFEDYWGGAPKLERVVLTSSDQVKRRREQIAAGATDVTTDLDCADWADLREDTGVTLYTWDAENLCYLALNCSPDCKHPTNDVRVRKAIAMAIDRGPIVETYSGAAVPHHVLLPPVTMGHPKGYKPSTDVGDRSERLAKARELVKAAGAEGAELPLWFPAVPRPYLLRPDAIADHIRQHLKEIGLNVTLHKREMKELTPDRASLNFAMTLIGWMGETGEPDNFWRPLLSGSNGKPAGQNHAHFYNAEVEKKVNDALYELDKDERVQRYEALEKWVHEEFRPMVPLLSSDQSVAWRSNVKGVYVDSTGTYRLHEAYFEK